MIDNTLQVNIEVRTVGWRPDLNVDTLATVLAFAELGKKATIPGPLVRVRAGTPVRITVSNRQSAKPLILSGLRAGTVLEDTLQFAPGQERVVTFTPKAQGTYLYWGKTGESVSDRPDARDSQLSGVIVVDAATGRVDPAERIMVLSLIDIYPDSARHITEEVWEVAINGRSWPHTERFRYNVGDTVRWRWVNATNRPHPMHLHGFHFRVTARGNGSTDTLYTPEQTQLAVTEFLPSGATFAMEWVPARSGKWLMHCHMIPHITPYPERSSDNRGHDVHDVRKHAEQAMAGLVIGITTVEPRRLAFWRKSSIPLIGNGPEQSLRVFIQQSADTGKVPRRSYVLQNGAEPARDSVNSVSSPLLLTRGQTTRITVINRLPRPSTIHWHGLELESIYDGVSGWSGDGRQFAPLLAPGDSFAVVLTPPRAGTYMYHTHMDEEDQLGSGLYGPIIVQEPGKKFDASTDLVLFYGGTVRDGKLTPAINGQPDPSPITLRAGTTYRLRLVNLRPVEAAKVSLVSGADTLSWHRIAKDGADLQRGQAVTTRAFQIVDVGEAYDFEWTPQQEMDATLTFQAKKVVTRQRFIVRTRPQP